MAKLSALRGKFVWAVVRWGLACVCSTEFGGVVSSEVSNVLVQCEVQSGARELSASGGAAAEM